MRRSTNFEQRREYIHHRQIPTIDVPTMQERLMMHKGCSPCTAFVQRSFNSTIWGCGRFCPSPPNGNKRSCLTHIGQTIIPSEVRLPRHSRSETGIGTRRTVVGEEEDHCVVELVGCSQILQETSNMVVHVFDHGRIQLHRSCVLLTRFGIQVLPGRRKPDVILDTGVIWDNSKLPGAVDASCS